MRYIARIRTPAAIDGAVIAPYAQQLLEHPSDGEILDQGSEAEDGSVVLAFDADDDAGAELHARLLAERAPGCQVLSVDPAGA